MNTLEEIRSLIQKSENILILTHHHPDGDGLGSSLALYLALQKLNKKATLACADPLPENLQFLPSSSALQQAFPATQDFIIWIDSSQTKIEKIEHTTLDQKIKITLTPSSGSLTPELVSFDQGPSPFDLTFILDTGDLAQLGPLYTQNVNFFYTCPLINIDHHISNTNFGRLNYTDPTASSTAEILTQIIQKLSPESPLLDADISTLLLTGIITDTGSFQNPNTSPKAFEAAAELLSSGARQQEIIHNVYKTKPLSTLKLWGLILSKIQHDTTHRLAWSSISASEFESISASPEQAGGIIDELLVSAPESEIILLIKEYQDITSVSIRTTSPSIDASRIAKLFGGGGHVQAAGFKLPQTPLPEAEPLILSRIREFQAERLGLGPTTSPQPKTQNPPESPPTPPEPQTEKPTPPTPNPTPPSPTPEINLPPNSSPTLTQELGTPPQNES